MAFYKRPLYVILIASCLVLTIDCQNMTQQEIDEAREILESIKLDCSEPEVQITRRHVVCYGFKNDAPKNLSWNGKGCFLSKDCDVEFKMAQQYDKTDGVTPVAISYSLQVKDDKDVGDKSETYELQITKEVLGWETSGKMIARIVKKGSDANAAVKKTIVTFDGKEEHEVTNGANAFTFETPTRLAESQSTRYFFLSKPILEYKKAEKNNFHTNLVKDFITMTIVIGDRATIQSGTTSLFKVKPSGWIGDLPPFGDIAEGDNTGFHGEDDEAGDPKSGTRTGLIIFLVILLILVIAAAIAITWWYGEKRRREGFNLDGSPVVAPMATQAGVAMRQVMHQSPTRRIGSFDLAEGTPRTGSAEKIAMRQIDPERPALQHFPTPGTSGESSSETGHAVARKSSRGSADRLAPQHIPTPGTSGESSSENGQATTRRTSHGSHSGHVNRLPGTHSTPLERAKSPKEVAARRHSSPNVSGPMSGHHA